MPYADDPFSLVIFGASGDLTRRKLVPALWSLYAARTLPEPFAIVGTGRTELTDAAFRNQMREAVTGFARLKIPSPQVWERFAQSLYYVAATRPDPTSICASASGWRRWSEHAAGRLTASSTARLPPACTTTSSATWARPGWRMHRPGGRES